MAKRTPEPIDTDPYRMSLRRRAKLDHVLDQAQGIIGMEFTVMGNPAADITLGHDAFDAIEKIRQRLARGPRYAAAFKGR